MVDFGDLPVVVTRLKAFVLYNLCILIGCSHIASENKVQLIFNKDIRMSYQGNSAVMMSMIGPEGIAIGAAIDEGVSKTFEANLSSKGGSKGVLTRCFDEISTQHPIGNISELFIENIAIVPQDDGFYALLQGSIKYQGKSLNFVGGKRDWGMKGELSSIKDDPMLTEQLLMRACKAIWLEWSTNHAS